MLHEWVNWPQHFWRRLRRLPPSNDAWDDERWTALYIKSLQGNPEAFRAWSGQQVLLPFWPASTHALCAQTLTTLCLLRLPSPQVVLVRPLSNQLK